MRKSELVVTGKDKISIKLNKYPKEVDVHFKQHHHPVPCNHHHHDELKWQVHVDYTNQYRPGYILVISWHVTDMREIEWVIKY